MFLLKFIHLESTSNLLRAAVKEACSGINYNKVEIPVAPETLVLKKMMQEPVVIMQNDNQSCVVQSLEIINEQNVHFVQQTLVQESLDQPQIIDHFSIVDEQNTKAIMIEVSN